MLKIGVIGIGAMGKNHARACTELETVELIGIADTDKQHPKDPLEAMKKRWSYLPIVKEKILFDTTIKNLFLKSLGFYIARGINIYPVFLDKDVLSNIGRLVTLKF